MSARLTVGRIVHYYGVRPVRGPIAALCIAVTADGSAAELELFPPTARGPVDGTLDIGTVLVGVDPGEQVNGTRWEWPPREDQDEASPPRGGATPRERDALQGPREPGAAST